MGNILSKSVPLRESLMKLEHQIKAEETKCKELKISMKKIGPRFCVALTVLAPSIAFFAYFDNRSMLLYLFLLTAASLVLKYAVVYLFSVRIQNIEAALEILREKQKEQIELLKRDEAFDATKKLVDKYETESSRKEYFGRIRQREHGVLDCVTDLVLGDDPSKMYALICKKCRCHNGLVHPSEYESVEYRCYNCGELNVKSRLPGKKS
jgi:hypothetical protein